MSRPSRLAILGILSAVLGAAVLGAGAATRWADLATEPRPAVTSTPSLPGLAVRTDVQLPSGEALCVEPVALESTTARAVLTVSGPVRAANLQAQFRSGREVLAGQSLRVDQGEPRALIVGFPPRRRRLEGALCLTNRGERSVVFVGTTEPRSLVPATTSVAGRTQPADIALTLLERRDTTLRDAAGTSIRRASALTGDVLPRFAVWATLALAVLAAVAMFPVFGALVAANWRTDPEGPGAPRGSPRSSSPARAP